jgi:hypothetical protein
MPDGTEARLTLAAPRSKVMGVIADIPAYPDWNREVRTAEVLSAAADGRPLQVRFVLDAGPIKDTYVLAYAWQGEERVQWHLEQGQVLTGMDGSYVLTEVGPDATEVTYALTVELNLPVLGLLKRKGERMIIDRALKGLQARVESL